ncbi:MAG: SDR family oxidoreductase [Rickettsiales bacterium]|nr:SDR family oxidoreductase [Rickettsiales bacterium]
MNNNRLANKIALITGGVNGIGKAIAELFSNHGAKVIVVDISDPQKNIKSNIDYLKLDISKEISWLEIHEYIKDKYAKLNILINNAGISGVSQFQDPEKMEFDTWNYIHAVNLSSIFFGCKFAINLMKNSKENCSIVNMASRSGIVGVANLAAYASSKAAIRNYTKSVAMYCAQQSYEIRCNTISPAAIDTNMWNHQKKDRNKFKLFSNSLPLQRMGHVQEVAYAALYLASDESLYTTGSEIIIDGGILCASSSTPK